MLPYEPLTQSVSNECDPIADHWHRDRRRGSGFGEKSVTTPGTENTRKRQAFNLIYLKTLSENLIVSNMIVMKSGFENCQDKKVEDGKQQ